MILAALLGLVPAMLTDVPTIVLALSLFPAAALGLALSVRLAGLVAFLLFVLGTGYGVALFFPHGPLASLAPLYGTTLLLAAELAYWSLSPTADVWGERVVIIRRLAGLGTMAFLALAIDGVLVAAASVSVPGGIVLFVVGFAAATGVIALLAFLARRTILA